VPFSENWQRFVREEVRRGRFPSEPAVVEGAPALLRQRESAHGQHETPNGTGLESIGEIIEELMGNVPDEVLDRLPVDGAAQHDHYLYGTPKRSS
jgi:hypothetical protein